MGSDGLNPMRALILQAYYSLRRTRLPGDIGTTDIVDGIETHEPHLNAPSAALVQLTLKGAKVAHRAPGRPRGAGCAPPFCAGGLARSKLRSNR